MKKLGVFLLGLAIVSASVGDSRAAIGFWGVLVLPKGRWVLNGFTDKENRINKVVVETYDVRRVAGVEVARLRWTWIHGKKPEDRSDWSGSDGRFSQVAVTAAGLYILDAGMDDTKVAAALKGKPSRSEPPKPYKASERNGGRYLRLEPFGDEELVCIGYEALPGAESCDDTCFGELCLSATRGPVQLHGTWAPNNGWFAQKGYDND